MCHPTRDIQRPAIVCNWSARQFFKKVELQHWWQLDQGVISWGDRPWRLPRHLLVLSKLTIALSHLKIFQYRIPIELWFTSKTIWIRKHEQTFTSSSWYQESLQLPSTYRFFDKIILFFGCKDLLDVCEPSNANPKDVASDLINLANTLVHHAEEAFVLGIPEKDENKLRAESPNMYLEAAAKWQ